MRFLTALVLFVSFGINAQRIIDVNSFNFLDLSSERGFPEYNFVYSNTLDAQEKVSFNIEFKKAVSVIGIGWDSQENANPSDFKVKYRSSNDGVNWTNYQDLDGDFTPEETPTNLYWTDAMFSYDAESYTFYEIEFFVPIKVDEFKLVAFDGNTDGVESKDKKIKSTPKTQPKSGNCPEFPEMIERSEWCGGSASCSQVNAWYNPTYISPTHVVMHHGASPNNYTDGQAVVRSYYNYHVNTLNWVDIGYNYIIDKDGNFYQGRHNPNLPTSDVRGAHAGTGPNNNSIGVNFPGNLDTELATQVQLEKLHKLLAWWFDYNNINVLGSSGMQTQDYGWQTQPHFTGHRDIGNTFCPGNDLHAQFPAIRSATQAVIDACAVPTDDVPPTTVAETNYEWRGYDFWVGFEDEDNPGGSGVDRRFYQVIEYDGNEWRANESQGFFNDNFNQNIHPDWSSFSGNWEINNGKLVQVDENESNSNIYAELNQNSDSEFQYHWQMRIEGSTSTNRRAGLHFFADDPEEAHRGNSYLAWWRADDNEFYLYKIENNSLDLVDITSMTIDLNTWYDMKVTFNSQTGDIEIYTDDELITSYTDPNPLTNGDYISLRNGDSKVLFDNFKVRKNRTIDEKITVGDIASKFARHESPTPSQDAARINTIVIDGAKNWSNEYANSIFVDWTEPTTTININSTFQTSDFNVDFNDNDNTNGSGLARSFYNVVDNDAGIWSANSDNGFLLDSLNTGGLNNNWQIVNGSWNAVNGYLEQSDETENNTNIYIPLNQNLSNRYLYDFDFKISGSGNNKRGGFHYFCDDPSASNRGNSYFLWFRQDSETIEIFKVVNNTFSVEKIIPFSFDSNDWFNVKMIYDRVTGEHLAYVDNKLIAEWIDDTPHFNGEYVSFRSGNSVMGVKNFSVYRTRHNNVTVSVGGLSSDIRYTNNNPSVPDAKVRSIVHDYAHNLSEVNEVNIFRMSNTANLNYNEKNELIIYPNPFQDKITISGLENSTDENIILTDIAGREVKIEKVQQNNGEVIIYLPKNIAKGSYQLMLSIDGKVRNYKVQKH